MFITLCHILVFLYCTILKTSTLLFPQIRRLSPLRSLFQPKSVSVFYKRRAWSVLHIALSKLVFSTNYLALTCMGLEQINIKGQSKIFKFFRKLKVCLTISYLSYSYL